MTLQIGRVLVISSFQTLNTPNHLIKKSIQSPVKNLRWSSLWKQLTHYRLVVPSYRNQSIDLHNKLIGWFLYESKTGS